MFCVSGVVIMSIIVIITIIIIRDSVHETWLLSYYRPDICAYDFPHNTVHSDDVRNLI